MWRLDAKNAALSDKACRRKFRKMCSEDPLFYINTCIWTFSPHDDDECSTIPLITYDYQDRLVLKIIDHAYRKKPLNVKKARDMGISWTVLAVGRWLCKFRRGYTMGVMSRKKDLVDQNGSMDALMPKLDFMYEHDMPFFKERRTRNDMIYHDLESDGKIRGETANPDAFRAGRQRLVLWDEAAVTPDAFSIAAGMAAAAACMVRVYTPQGSGSEPASLERAGVDTEQLPWWLNPLHARGEYRIERGQAVVVDREWHDANPGYPFVTTGPTVRDGMRRSPWYDGECVKLHNIPLLIAQELEMNDSMASSHVFDIEFLEKTIQEVCRPPLGIGHLSPATAYQPAKFEAVGFGDLKLWCALPFGRPQSDRTYTVSCDVSFGTGASNSTIVVTDDKLGEKVGEWANANTLPHKMAEIAMEIGRFFKDAKGTPALLVWEANGPGRDFGKCIEDAGYENLWYENGRERSSFPGWSSTSEKKKLLLGEYKMAQMQGEYVDRSVESVSEQKNYVIMANGSFAYSDTRGIVDPSGANENHGDRLIATALGSKVSKARKVELAAKESEYQVGSRGWFNQQRADAEARKANARRTWRRNRHLGHHPFLKT